MADLGLDTPLQMTWHRPKSKDGCRRDPAAGPGTCWHWWDGCPKADKRGCYLIWAKRPADAGNLRNPDGSARKPDA